MPHRLLALLVLLVCVAGCETGGPGRAGKPSARIESVRLDGVTVESAKLLFNIDVSNPYDFPLPLTNLDFSLATQGDAFATGSAEAQGEVPANGKKRITVPVTATFSELFAAAKSVRPGQVVPYVATFTFSADAPAVGTLSLPVTHRGELPVPTAPEVRLAAIRWTELSLDDARGTMGLRVINRNDFPLDLIRLDYALTLSGIEVAHASMPHKVQFTPGGEQLLELPLRFAPRRMGFEVYKMLGGQGADYRIKGTMDGGTPYGDIEMPYEKTGSTTFLRR